MTYKEFKLLILVLLLSISLFPLTNCTYKIQSSNRSVNIVNCTFHSCQGIKGPWRRVANLNTSDANSFSECPSRLIRESDPLSCKYHYFNPGCVSIRYETGTSSYSKICAKMHARYSGSPDAFQNFGGVRNPSTYEENYLVGVSLPYGRNPRTHVWSFAALVNVKSKGCSVCEKTKPSFVGTDFSCELVMQCPKNTVCNSEVLWKGCQCVGGESFYKEFSCFITQDLEIRLCRGQHRHDEDILITFIELFVM